MHFMKMARDCLRAVVAFSGFLWYLPLRLLKCRRTE